MHGTLRIEAAELGMAALDALDVDSLAVFVGPERPLQGLAGWVDWRLCGALSHALRDGFYDGGEREVQELAEQLVRGVHRERRAIDERIEGASTNWRVDRMARVDRNALRLAVFELLHGDAPVKVIINEAIELGKKFGSESSGAFVNGVLDRIAGALPAERRQG